MEPTQRTREHGVGVCLEKASKGILTEVQERSVQDELSNLVI